MQGRKRVLFLHSAFQWGKVHRFSHRSLLYGLYNLYTQTHVNTKWRKADSGILYHIWYACDNHSEIVLWYEAIVCWGGEGCCFVFRWIYGYRAGRVHFSRPPCCLCGVCVWEREWVYYHLAVLWVCTTTVVNQIGINLRLWWGIFPSPYLLFTSFVWLKVYLGNFVVVVFSPNRKSYSLSTVMFLYILQSTYIVDMHCMHVIAILVVSIFTF